MSLLHSAEEVPGLRCVSQRSATYSSLPRSRQLALAKHLLRVAGTWEHLQKQSIERQTRQFQAVVRDSVMVGEWVVPKPVPLQW